MESMFLYAWCHLLKQHKKGSMFLIPQYHVGPYIADFAHVQTKTIIEVDGKDYHSSDEQVEHDLRCQCYLEHEGWTVIRFSGSMIYHHSHLCSEIIYEHVKYHLEHIE